MRRHKKESKKMEKDGLRRVELGIRLRDQKNKTKKKTIQKHILTDKNIYRKINETEDKINKISNKIEDAEKKTQTLKNKLKEYQYRIIKLNNYLR